MRSYRSWSLLVLSVFLGMVLSVQPGLATGAPCDCEGKTEIFLCDGDEPTKGDDCIIGGACLVDGDEIEAVKGDDVICPDTGAAITIHGGFGNDTLNVLYPNQTFNGGCGDDVVLSQMDGTYLGGLGCDSVGPPATGSIDLGRQDGKDCKGVSGPTCPTCGDGLPQAGEECDDGPLNGSEQSSCTSECTIVACVPTGAEVCNDGVDNDCDGTADGAGCILAVAYVDVNSNDVFDAGDGLIAAMLDDNTTGAPDSGDSLSTDVFPTTLPNPSNTAGVFGVKSTSCGAGSGTIADVGVKCVAAGAQYQIQNNGIDFEYFVEITGVTDITVVITDQTRTATATPDTIGIGGFTASPLVPTPASLSAGLVQGGDQDFVDVDLFLSSP